jgi:hypothetical protein
MKDPDSSPEDLNGDDDETVSVLFNEDFESDYYGDDEED